MSKQDSASADRAAHQAVPDHAVADRRGRVVAAARGDHDSRRQPEVACDVRSNLARGGRRFVHPRQPLDRNFQRVDDLARPSALFQIEQQGARRVGGVSRLLAREPQAQIVLRQQDAVQPRIRLRLFVAQPQDLGRLEPGQRRIACDLDEPVRAYPLGDRLTLRRRPLVVPEERGPDDVIRLVEKDRAVHLARETEADDVASDVGCNLGDRAPGSLPPVFRPLLGPSRPWAGRGVLDACLGANSALMVDRDAADSAGPDVDAEEMAHATAIGSQAEVRNPASTAGQSPESEP